MKYNTEVLIDGENMSHKKADLIMQIAASQGALYESRVYGRQKDQRTRGWTDKAKKHGIKDIRLYGGPKKNKVDNKIKKDANRIMFNNKNVDIFVIATSDSDYIEEIKNLRMHGKRVVVVGSKQAPASLRESCNKFIEV
ncbi:MAG: NYN domain-containing protein [Eubacterium sp.]|nr:NYN domain-containing protein [Eubacterium sp.]